MKWNSYPFFRITLVFILGIGMNEVLKAKIPALYVWIFAAMVFVFYIIQSFRAHRKKEIGHNSMAALLSFLLLGMLSAQVTEYIHKPSISRDDIGKVSYYTLTVKSIPTPTIRTNKYRVGIDRMRLGEKWVHTKAEALLYVRKNMGQTLAYGDKLLIKGHPEFLENQKNPHAFDYTLFLQRKGIYLQDFLNANNYVKLSENHGFSFTYMKLQLADYFEQVLEKFIPNDRELNFAKAMLVGRKDDITREMESVYASTGTAHILAVSGLHEGIIYLLVSMLLKRLKNGRLRWLYYGANLCAVWIFAIFTGLSPSAQRAATMLSCIIIAQYSGRKSNIYNSILVSAFILLLFSPNLIFSVSFQLSYMAVFGIVYLYPKLYHLLYVENKILDFFWKITVLSFATQIATFPISIYYFHQFPLLFPFTNLIAIPTATAVISGGLLLLVTASLGIVPVAIGKALGIWIGWYNDLMLLISKVPFHSLTDIHLKVVYVVLIICCMFLLAHFLTTRKLVFFRAFTLFIVVFSFVKGYDYYRNSIQKEVVFYAMNDGPGVDVFIGNSCFTNIIPMDSSHITEVKYNVTPARKYHHIRKIHHLNDLGIVREIGGNIWIQLGGKTILLLQYPEGLPENITNFPLDYVVVGKRMQKKLPEVLIGLQFDKLVLNDSMPQAVTAKILLKMGRKAMKIHAIQRDGAFIIRI